MAMTIGAFLSSINLAIQKLISEYGLNLLPSLREAEPFRRMVVTLGVSSCVFLSLLAYFIFGVRLETLPLPVVRLMAVLSILLEFATGCLLTYAFPSAPKGAYLCIECVDIYVYNI